MANPILKNQIISLSTAPVMLTAGQQFTVNVGYNVSDANNLLPGIGFGIHFDNTKLQLNGITPSSAPDLFGTAVNAESVNDNNVATNQEISWAYLDIFGNWPNQALPIALGTVTFTALAPFDTSTLNLPVTVNQPAIGYTGPTSLAIAPATSVQNEGDINLTPFTFTVTRSGDTSVGITAQVDVTGSSANPANAADFGGAFPSQTVIFLAGETSKTITINVSGDTVVEPDEQFTVTLGNPTNATTTNTTFTNTTATSTIIDDDAVPVFAIASANATEGNAIAFTVTRTGDAQATQSVTVATSIGGTNTAIATDFTPISQILSFAQGETTKTFNVQTTQDTLFEGDETISATLSAATGGATISGTNGAVTGTINNDEVAPVFAIASANATEGNAIAFTVTRTGDAQATQSVTVATSIGGTDTASATDFTPISQILSFAQGETTKTFNVQTTQDILFEGDETISANLSTATGGATISGTNGAVTGTINNDEVAPVFAISSASATEGNAIAFTVTRTGDAQATQSVTVATSIGGTDNASVNDFTANTKILSFAQGETTKTFSIPTTQDLLPEADETFTATLSAPSNGATLSATNGKATGTIKDATISQPSLAIAPATITQDEGNAGITSFTFTATRSGDTTGTSTANFAVTGSGANPADGADFIGGTFPTGTVNFAAGDTTKTITINVAGDTNVEPNENFTVTLSNPINALLITPSAIGTITNDDTTAPSFAIASANATEGGLVNFTVTRTGDAQAAQSVSVATSIGGTDTTIANDFAAKTQTLTFAQGETTKTFTVQSTQDTLFEGNETFTTTLSTATGGATISGTNGTAIGTINNDEVAPVFTIASASATEGNAIAFTATRTGDAQATQSVTVATSIGGTDTAIVNDFTPDTQTLSFAQGETTKTFTVQTIQDVLSEADETFTATLTNPSNGATIGTNTAIGTIIDDDNPRISLAIAPASVLENGIINLVYTFTRTGVTTSALTVNYNVSGTTTFGNDYSQTGAATFNASTGTVIFATNSATATVTIDPTADIIFEPDETIALTLVNGSGYNIDTTTPVTGTIANDESAPVFAIAAATATEGGATLFTITRTGDAQSTQSVIVTTSISATDNVISASDFTTKTETLSFAQGETTKTFSVQTTQDTLFESNETFTATLSTPTNGAIISTTNGTANGTINNDDPAPIFAIIASVSSIEGGLLNFTVTRSGDAQATQAVTVSTAISSTDTTSLTDFTPKNETLTFAQGETTKTFSVQSTQDNIFESNETFTTSLSTATNGAVISSANGFAKGTINNDDPIPKATLSRGSNDVFRLDGLNTAKLKVSFTDASSSSVNAIGFFNVDDATGKIGSFSIGSAGYAQAALERSKVIFSTIANNPSGYDPTIISLMEAAGNFRFYLIKSGTTTEEAQRSSNSSNILFSTSSAKITDLGNGSFAIAWDDGSSNDFKSLSIKIEGSDDPLAIDTKQQGNSFNGKGGGEVIDLRFASGLAADTKSVNADFVVNREAAFNNFVGFYKVTDTNGGIDINGDGIADFTPGQSGYILAAVQNRVAGIDLAVSNQGSALMTGKTFAANSIFAPFIIVNGNTSSFADNNTSNDPAVYFSYLGANTDGVDHIRLLGSNTFGFEDLAGGGDRDFNDIIVKATLTAVK